MTPRMGETVKLQTMKRKLRSKALPLLLKYTGRLGGVPCKAVGTRGADQQNTFKKEQGGHEVRKRAAALAYLPK